MGLRVSGHTWQNNDPPPEFTGTKPSEFEKYREKVRRWLLFTRTPAHLRGPHVLSRLTGPAWDACDELEPEDVATADGVNMILDTLAEAFQGEYDVSGSHTVYVSQAKEALIEQEKDINLETAPAALELESDTHLEETDVQEVPLAYKESRQLRGEQRVNCDQEYGVCSDDVSCRPNVALQGSGHGKFCTGVVDEVQNCGSSRACEGRVEGRLPVERMELMAFMQRDVRRRSVQSFGVREESTGQEHARSQEYKCSEMVKRRRHHSLSTSEETTARQTTLAEE